jgi:four helix bundle protein
MNMYNEFYDLEVWKEARKYRRSCSALARQFPKDETYRLTDQLLRASRSVTANIAESHGRYHMKELVQFQRHSKGSLKETLDHLFCAFDEGYINEIQFQEMKAQYEIVLKLLNGYIGYLQKRAA